MPKKKSASPAVIELQKLLGGYLFVQPEIAAQNTDRYSRPIPFLIDPASDRTLIVPMWHEEIEKCGVIMDDEVRRNLTLIGTVTYQVAYDIDVVLLCADLNTTCRQTIKELAFVSPGQPFDGSLSNSEATGANAHLDDTSVESMGDSDVMADIPVAVNILGLDFLNNFTLISETGTSGRAYLIKNDPGIVGALRKSSALRASFTKMDVPKIHGVEFYDLPASSVRE